MMINVLYRFKKTDQFTAYLLLLLLLSVTCKVQAQQQETRTDTLTYRLIELRDSAPAFQQRPEPRARVENTLPEFTGDSVASSWLNGQMRSMLKIDPEKSVEAAIQESQQAYLADYSAVMANFQDDSTSLSMNYENSSVVSVPYNAHGYVIVRNAIHDYSGGAHGNHGRAYYAFDVPDQKLMVQEDVLDIDSISLQTLLEEQFRKQYDFQPDQPLKDLLFEEELKPNDNFFFTDEGLGFCYVPYEIAPYAAGVIEIIIPYEKLTNYLQPAFAYRMHIEDNADVQSPLDTIMPRKRSAADTSAVDTTTTRGPKGKAADTDNDF